MQANFNIFQISKPPSFCPGWDSNLPLSLQSLGPECSLFAFSDTYIIHNYAYALMQKNTIFGLFRLVNFTKFTTIEIKV